jgi:hypothetical protein
MNQQSTRVAVSGLRWMLGLVILLESAHFRARSSRRPRGRQYWSSALDSACPRRKRGVGRALIPRASPKVRLGATCCFSSSRSPSPFICFTANITWEASLDYGTSLDFRALRLRPET